MTQAVAPGMPPATPNTLSMVLGWFSHEKRSLSSFLVQQVNFKSLLITSDPKKFGESRKTQLSASFFLFYSNIFLFVLKLVQVHSSF